MAFPTTSVLSSFTGADENPLSESAAWAGPTEYASAQMCRFSSAAKAAGLGGSSYWTAVTAANLEAFVDVMTLPGSGKGVEVWLRIQTPNDDTATTAYLWVYTVGTGFEWYKLTAGHTFTQIGGAFTPHTLAMGESIGASVIGTTLSGYYKSGGVWTLVDSRTDATISGAGRVGLQADDTTAVLDNFGGGAVVVGGAPVNTVTPVASGTTTVGQTLSTTNGTWTGSPTSFSYQWRRDNLGLGTYANISSATASTYVVTSADDYCHLLCAVTATNATGSVAANSNALGTVVEAAVTSFSPSLSTVTADVFTVIDGGRGGLPQLCVEIDVTNDPTNPVRVWTDFTAYVRSLSFSRSGRNDELQQTAPGTLSGVFSNRGDVLVAAGVRKSQWIRVRAEWASVIYPRWQGIIATVPRQWPQAGHDATIEIQAADVLKVFNLYDLAGETFPAQRNDERVAAIAALVGISTTSIDTDTDDAAAIVDPISEGTTALSMLLEIEASESGLLIAEPDGTLSFQGRHWRLLNSATPIATLGEGGSDIPYRDTVVREDDDTRIANIVSVTPAGGAAAVVVDDAASKAKYFDRRLNLTLLSSDPELAQSAAEDRLNRYADPTPRIPSIDLILQSRVAGWPVMLAANNSDRVNWTRAATTPINEDAFCEQITETVIPNTDWEMALQLSPAADDSGWRLDAPSIPLGPLAKLIY